MVASPSRRQLNYSPGPSRWSMRGDLLSSLALLREGISANADLDWRQMVSEHPVTGASEMPQMLTFLAQHERRHQRQIAAVRSDSEVPSSEPDD
jgi:hypothetical protein